MAIRSERAERSSLHARTRERSFLLALVMTTAKMIFFLVLLLGVSVTGLLVGVSKAWVETLPQLDLTAFDKQALTSFIYDRYGNKLTDYRGIENRVDAKYSEVPKYLIDAVISVEDARFRSHNGIDIRRIVGALVANLLDSKAEGGSTISQQVIKQTILSDEQTFKRKLQALTGCLTF